MGSPNRAIGTRYRIAISALVRVVAGCAALVPLVVALAYVHRWGRDVPFWDEWDRSAHLAVLAADGTLTFDDVFRAHNEHRLLFSAIVTVANAHLAGWSLVGEMYLGIALSFVAYLMLVAIVRQQSRDRRTVVVLGVPLAMLVFWPAQWFNWLVGFQTQVYGFMAFSTAAISVVARRKPGWGPLGAAAILANGAQFSQAGGIAIWPALLIGLWMLKYRRVQLAAWVLVAAVSLGAFFHGYAISSPSHVGIGGSGAFALAYLGGFFVGAFDDRLVGVAIVAAVAGLALFAWNLVLVRRDDGGWSRAAPWVMLVVLGLGTAVLVARNRAHLGSSYALVSRYATQASLVWLGLCGICGCVVEGRTERAPRDLRGAAVSAWSVLALVLFLYVPTARESLSHGLVSDDQVACLQRLPATGVFACLAGTHPVFDADFPDAGDRRAILDLVNGLARNRLLVFAPEAGAAATDRRP